VFAEVNYLIEELAYIVIVVIITWLRLVLESRLWYLTYLSNNDMAIINVWIKFYLEDKLI